MNKVEAKKMQRGTEEQALDMLKARQKEKLVSLGDEVKSHLNPTPACSELTFFTSLRDE